MPCLQLAWGIQVVAKCPRPLLPLLSPCSTHKMSICNNSACQGMKGKVETAHAQPTRRCV